MAPTASSALASMTGFARRSGGIGALSYVWELRSVNAKGLDIRVRLPNSLDRLEPAVRKATQGALVRGSIGIGLLLERSESRPRYRLNQALVDDLIGLAGAIEAAGAPAQRLDGLLTVKGVLEIEDDTTDLPDDAALDAALLADFSDALSSLAAARAEEGARLQAVLADQLATMEGLIGEAQALAATQPAALQARLTEQLDRLVSDRTDAPDPDRLAQEVALLAAKADVREELDRLVAHIAQARDLLASADAVGRRLDFLCQEFNREANTLCSKSADLALTRIGLDLKATVERFREQVQNIE